LFGREIGIDLGTQNLLTLSTGEVIPNPRFGLAAHARLTTLRTRLHQAVRGSKAYIKALLRLGGLQVRVAARRRDHISKIVARLVKDYDRIAVENLDNHKLAKMRASISDAGWGAFCRVLAAKAAATGKTVTFVQPAWTSQTCSACGVRAERYLTMDQRQFTCDACGYIADRDLNAARLILLRGREIWETT
jgi:putative transposase